MNSPHTEHRPGVRPEYPGQMESDPIQVLHATIDRLITYLNHHQNPQTPVHQPLDPQQLAAHVDLTLGEAGLTLDELLPWIETYLHHSTATANPRFLNLLFGGVNWPGLLGELVMSVTNTTLHTYDVAPLATLMELELVRTLRTLVGFSQGEGLLVSGGSQANLVALLCARHRYGPEVKAQGMQGPPLVAFVSDQAHYSYDRAMNTLGLGLNHLVKVPSTVAGQLDPQALETAIQDHTRLGHRPFFIGATAGTTVRGAFDPLEPLADLAQTYDLWLHVDGAWGAPVLLSDRHAHLLRGCDRADSFTWDGHKLMGVPLMASMILIKEPGLLQTACGGGGDDYLFHGSGLDPAETSYDLGQRSLQCGRRADSVKFWFAWKAHGHGGYRARLHRLFDLRDYAVQWIQRCDRLELLEPPPFLNVCFRYKPTSWQGSDLELSHLNRLMRDRLVQTGQVFVNFAQVKRGGETLGMVRLVLPNPDTQTQDLDRLFDTFLAQAPTSSR